MFKIYIKKTAFFLISILFFLLSLVLLNYPSDASEANYSIQTGTYSLTALDFAEKHFEVLTEKLTEDEREGLRIEEGSKYYIVRLGRFNNAPEAEKVLKKVKTIASDAFILKVAGLESVKILKSYDDKDPKKAEKNLTEKLAGGYEEESMEMIDQDSRTNRSGSYTDSKGPEADNVPEGLPVDENNEDQQLNKLLEEVSVQFDNKDYKKASELLKRGLKKWPDDPDLHAWYGATLLDSGSPEKAYKEYRRAAELMPDVPDFHAGMGHSLLDSYIDRAKNSVTAFKQALEIDPDNVSALEGLGIVYVSMGRKLLAAEIYQHLKEIDSEAAARLNEFIIWGLDWGETK